MIPATIMGEVTAPAPATDISRVFGPGPGPAPVPAPTMSNHLSSSPSFSYQKFLATPLH